MFDISIFFRNNKTWRAKLVMKNSNKTHIRNRKFTNKLNENETLVCHIFLRLPSDDFSMMKLYFPIVQSKTNFLIRI